MGVRAGRARRVSETPRGSASSARDLGQGLQPRDHGRPQLTRGGRAASSLRQCQGMMTGGRWVGRGTAQQKHREPESPAGTCVRPPGGWPRSSESPTAAPLFGSAPLSNVPMDHLWLQAWGWAPWTEGPTHKKLAGQPRQQQTK